MWLSWYTAIGIGHGDLKSCAQFSMRVWKWDHVFARSLTYHRAPPLSYFRHPSFVAYPANPAQAWLANNAARNSGLTPPARLRLVLGAVASGRTYCAERVPPLFTALGTEIRAHQPVIARERHRQTEPGPPPSQRSYPTAKNFKRLEKPTLLLPTPAVPTFPVPPAMPNLSLLLPRDAATGGAKR